MGILSGIFKSRDKPQNAHLVAHTDSLSAAVPGARMSNVPIDLMDEANTAGALSGIVSHKTQLKMLSVVPDVNAELEQMQKEQDETGYNTDYPTKRTTEEEDIEEEQEE